jgi:hypothetical protein
MFHFTDNYRGNRVSTVGGGTSGGILDEGVGDDGLVSRTHNRIRHMRGKYTTKEEIVRQIAVDHPCRLTSTAVKISFPGMKSEVLVSFLGYKEPNLMFVNRCKGLCSSPASASGLAACVPTRRTWKKVNMQLKTQYLGRDVREKMRELVLEEHEECGCRDSGRQITAFINSVDLT